MNIARLAKYLFNKYVLLQVLAQKLFCPTVKCLLDKSLFNLVLWKFFKFISCHYINKVYEIEEIISFRFVSILSYIYLINIKSYLLNFKL